MPTNQRSTTSPYPRIAALAGARAADPAPELPWWLKPPLALLDLVVVWCCLGGAAVSLQKQSLIGFLISVAVFIGLFTATRRVRGWLGVWWLRRGLRRGGA